MYGPATSDMAVNHEFDATTEKWHCAATYLVYLNNRYHDPTLGTFISVDPLVVKTGEAYIYASGNPVTWSDPTGLETFGDMTQKGFEDLAAGRTQLIASVGNQSLADLFSGVGMTKASDGGRGYEAAARSWISDTTPWSTLTLDELRTTNEMMADLVANSLIEYIPLRYLLAAMPTATIETIFAAASSIESNWTRGSKPRPYDRMCGCGEMTRPDGDGVLILAKMFAGPFDSDAAAGYVGSASVTGLPMFAVTGAESFFPSPLEVGLGFLAFAYLQIADNVVDPNLKANPAAYWMDLSGMPAWPPRTQ